MSDNYRSDMKNRKILLSWFTGASATYLNLGLTVEQQICLYEECVGIALEQSDLKLLFLCQQAFMSLYQQTLSGPWKSNEEEEFENKNAKINEYLHLTAIKMNEKEYDDAISYSEKCLPIAKESGHKVAEMTAYMMLGDAHLKKEEYDDAISYSEKCLAIAQESGHKMAEMTAYMMLGDAHLKREEYDVVIFYSRRYLTTAKESAHKEAEMIAYKMLGDAHFKKEEYDDAILHSKECLAIAQESGNKDAEMNAYLTLGGAQLKKKEYNDAILHSKKCLAIAQESGDKEAEMKAYMTLGDAHLKKEEYDDAILYSKKCLNIAQESGDKAAEMKAYQTLGGAHLEKEELDAVYVSSTKGMAIARELEDKESMILFRAILSTINDRVGLPDRYQDDLFEFTIDKLRGGGQENQCYLYWVNCYMLYRQHRENHEYGEAISCLKGVIGSVQLIKNVVPLWSCKDGISKMYVLLGQYDEGIQYQQEALDIALKEGKKFLQAMSHGSLGEVYYKLEQLDKAEKSLKDSLKCYEFIFDGLEENDRFKIAFDDQHKEIHKMLLKLLIETNKKEEALMLSDYYRAKALKDLLVASYGFNKEQIAKDGLQYADVQSLVSSGNYTILHYSTCFEKLCTFQVEAGNELEFSVQHFDYCDGCLDKLVDKTFRDMDVRQLVNCEDRSLDVMDDSEVNKNREEDELTQLLTQQRQKRLSEECRSICGCRGEPSENSDESSLTSGLEILYHKLMHNIKHTQTEIVIIPEGPLCKLPFAALRDPDTGQYLSELKRIRMAPSITSRKLLEECPMEHHSRKDALIIGADKVGRVMLNGVEREILSLKGVGQEAKDIGLILGVEPLSGDHATKSAVLEKLQGGASVVHIAAHGDLEKATIVLAPCPEIRKKKVPDEEDYMLTMADVQQAQVRAQLVVLSCCHSGRGDIKAEGVVGMCRAFLASGARAVVGSLWAVDDEATWKFMKTFYKHLKDGKSASTSLHLTMNDMRKSPQYSEPKYWAPFFLMGDDVTIQFKD